MDTLFNLLEQSWQWTGKEIGITFAILLGTFVAKWLFKHLMTRAAKRLARVTTTHLDDMLIMAVEKPLEWVIVVLGLYLAIYTLRPPEMVMGC